MQDVVIAAWHEALIPLLISHFCICDNDVSGLLLTRCCPPHASRLGAAGRSPADKAPPKLC
jgi:hypothetical protein